MLSIALLGAPQIRRDGRLINLARRRSRALIYYLAAQPGPVSREQLMALLWADHERGAAQQLLRTTLHGIRKAGIALIADERRLALPAECAVDLRDLIAAVVRPAPRTDQLAAALEAYRGEFLAGFLLPDCPTFEHWIAGEREHYRQLALRGLGALAEQYAGAGHYAQGLATLSRALAIEPLREDLQRAAMRVQYLMGDRAGAIRRFEQLRDLLDAELGVPPMEQTRQLYDAIIRDDAPQPAGSRPPVQGGLHGLVLSGLRSATSLLPFSGREQELARLRRGVAAGRLLMIEGEPGIGKTRLAEEFMHERGGIILIGAARELEHMLPYQPLIDALRSLISGLDWSILRNELELPQLWLSELARLLPELLPEAPPAPPADESRLWEAISRFFKALARHRPVTLLLDDLQWAGSATLGLLGYLARQASEDSPALLATARQITPRSPLAALVQTLAREQRLERIVLGRLHAADMQVMARALSPQDSHRLATWLEHSSEGNPYILAELVRHARDEGLLLADGTFNLSERSATPVVPPTVYSLIQSRLAGLTAPAHQMLDVGVAAGREFEFVVVARAAELAESAALDALDELVAARLIKPLDGLRYRFDHSLIMEVAYREIGEPRHRMLHRRLAEAIELHHRDDPDEVAGLLASHFAEGLNFERAASYALRAARRAARLAAWNEAIDFYEQALGTTAAIDRFAAMIALAEAYIQTGQAGLAGERYRAAIDLAASRDEADTARLGLAQALIAQTRFAEMIGLAQEIGRSDNPTAQARALFLWGAALSIEGSDLAGATERLTQAEAMLEQQSAADPAARAQVRFELGSVAAQRGDLERAIARYYEALAIAETHTDASTVQWRILAHNNLGYHLHLLGDLASAEDHARSGLALAEERGFLSLQPFLYSTLAELALARNDLAAAEQAATRGLALAEQLHSLERIAGLTAILGLLAARRNDTALAVHRLSSALAHADDLGTRHLAAQIRIWLAPLLPPPAAQALLAEARAIAEAGGRKRLMDEILQVEQTIAERTV